MRGDGAAGGRRRRPHIGAGREGGALDVIEAEIVRRGFQPRRVDADNAPAVVLQRCAFADAAARAPGVVCVLHRGLAEGIVDALGGYEVCDLVANDPATAGRRLQFRRLPPAPA